jgi:SAM-dependent methyltransferase
MALGKLAQAIEALRQVLRLQPDRREARWMMGNAFRFLKPTRYEPVLEEDLKACFSASDINSQFLAKVTANQLRHKHRIDTRLQNDFDALATDVGADELLLTMLAKTINVDPMLERLLTAIRRRLLFKLRDAFEIPTVQATLVVALGLQCFGNEYVFATQPDEEDAVRRLQVRLESLVETHTIPSSTLEAPLLLFVMYRPMDKLVCAQILASIALNAWSAPVQPLVVRTLKEPLEERAIGKTIESLGEIADPTSQIVQSQYEELSYPRWLDMRRSRKVRFDTLLRKNYPHFTPPDFLNGLTRVLIAGCGTGQQPIAAALGRENTEIVAVDLSRRSLAYAVRMARKSGVDNIRFLQADILGLSQLRERFHVIESVGVLHHMADPMRGWRVLTDLLVPDGLMKIGLYSEQARASVVAARQRIQRDELKPVHNDIKKFRTAVLAGETSSVMAELLEIPDFYSLSECRDLVFHAVEHRFTLPQIAQALDDLNLSFIGFEIPAPQVKQRYRESCPEDTHLIDLEGWHRFEQSNPHTFLGMYVFWCQRKGTNSS